MCTRICVRLFCVGVLTFFSVFGAMGHAQARAFRTLYSLCKSGSPCADGEEPDSKLTMDPAGNLFGTTNYGGTGTNNQGIAFELVNQGNGKWKYRVIHNFCSESDCTDGSFPMGLIAAADGSLYGVTANGGGGSHEGVAFRLVPNRKGTKYKFVSLYAFCSQQNCTDGAIPQSQLAYAGAASGALYDGVSPLYGISGGNAGAIFELRPGKTSKVKIIYRFCSQTNCADGIAPKDLTLDASGKTIFGVTGSGGNSNDQGVIYQLTAGHNAWTINVLYSFCQEFPCPDGAAPQSVLLDKDGSLYGVAAQGGDMGAGTAFEFDLHSLQFSRLYSFCAQSDCADGANPAGLSADGSGKLFGITHQGGEGETPGGTIFSLSGGAEQVLYTFCSLNNCADGSNPTSGVILDQGGNIYGATDAGGANQQGVVYVLKR